MATAIASSALRADLAEYLAQETYLRLLRQVEPVQILKPKAFLLQVARNLFLTGNRQILRRAELDIFNLGTQPGAEAAGQVETLVLKNIVLGMPQKASGRLRAQPL
ncbi:hypothetical protein [Caulobacter sp. DWR2-3-1b2]|uniref:hypothetical protein n=1 Tax=unclassified Caulobacter TaxID=2648921 RepID=UPI003CEB62B2